MCLILICIQKVNPPPPMQKQRGRGMKERRETVATAGRVRAVRPGLRWRSWPCLGGQLKQNGVTTCVNVQFAGAAAALMETRRLIFSFSLASRLPDSTPACRQMKRYLCIFIVLFNACQRMQFLNSTAHPPPCMTTPICLPLHPAWGGWGWRWGGA